MRLTHCQETDFHPEMKNWGQSKISFTVTCSGGRIVLIFDLTPIFFRGSRGKPSAFRTRLVPGSGFVVCYNFCSELLLIHLDIWPIDPQNTRLREKTGCPLRHSVQHLTARRIEAGVLLSMR
jgi:hypothetical protein